MPSNKQTHLTKDNREVIENGIIAEESATKIAKRISCPTSTVTREVKRNRSITERKTKVLQKTPSLRCAKRRDCECIGSACGTCQTAFTNCKDCKTRDCTKKCPDFKLTMCPTTEKWPYVCPEKCAKRGQCSYPRVRYRAQEADDSYRVRLADSRSGIAVSAEELESMNEIIVPLVKQGHSFEAIWANHADDLPVCTRTGYNYQKAGVLGVAAIELPQSVRRRSRKKPKAYTRDRVDRTDRLHEDFLRLSLEEQVRVVQCDSVEGYKHNACDVLSMHIVARKFQFYIKKRHAISADTVAILDYIECKLGSREAFEAIFGILLCDRGPEFDDWEGMERSVFDPTKKRCHVYYCDAMISNQKSQAERNHEQLRRILPKGRSDFDALSNTDVALCCSHANSYPLATLGGKCAFEQVEGLVPKALLDELGYKRLPPDKVVLKPYLMVHAVKQ